MKSQKNAVCSTLLSILNERGVEYELNSELSMKSVLTPEDVKQCRAIIKAGIIANEIVFSESARLKYLGPENDSKLNSYVSGLVNNHIRKTKEFNGGIGYTPENPGSRQGNSDETVKALKALLKKTPASEVELIQEINQALSERLVELKPEVEINAEALPEHLRKFA